MTIVINAVHCVDTFPNHKYSSVIIEDAGTFAIPGAVAATFAVTVAATIPDARTVAITLTMHKVDVIIVVVILAATIPDARTIPITTTFTDRISYVF